MSNKVRWQSGRRFGYTSVKGVNAYAFDDDGYIPRSWLHCNDTGQGKVKPPPRQVTVSLK
jgi:hypothetical protein